MVELTVDRVLHGKTQDDRRQKTNRSQKKSEMKASFYVVWLYEDRT
jgi:hypothetical protein